MATKTVISKHAAKSADFLMRGVDTCLHKDVKDAFKKWEERRGIKGKKFNAFNG